MRIVMNAFGYARVDQRISIILRASTLTLYIDAAVVSVPVVEESKIQSEVGA